MGKTTHYKLDIYHFPELMTSAFAMIILDTLAYSKTILTLKLYNMSNICYKGVGLLNLA